MQKLVVILPRVLVFWGLVLTLSDVACWAEPVGLGKRVPAGPGEVISAGRGTGHWRNYDVTDGLAGLDVSAIVKDREGRLWFGINGSGVSRYDGREFTTFTTDDGLAGNAVVSILEDREGHLWFGTDGGVASRFDGQVFQTLTHRDGLTGHSVRSILQDREGAIWFATYNGVTRYRPPSPSPPPIVIDAVVAGGRHAGVSELALSSSTGLVTFEFHGKSFKTSPDGIVYRYQLKGYDEGWKTTNTRHVEYKNLPRGTYIFEIEAVDRDLVYSEAPAEVKVIVHLDYVLIVLQAGLTVSLVGLVAISVRSTRRRRERDRAREQLLREQEKELQTAHDMQMGLMPTESPQIHGFNIAGSCISANHVGGDFFQYFPQDGKLSICLADVTGHAMEAAIPVVMFNGILESQMELGGSLEDLFARLNRSMYRTRMDSRTFVCFAMGELDTSTRQFRLSNGGCPYPYHFRASMGEITELQVDAYPLGVRVESSYPVIEVQLGPEDRVVFCSDGVIEAENSVGEIFGFEQTAETIRKGCQEGLSASALLDRIIGEVKAFAGDTPQGDDQTIVVLQVEP